MQDQEPTEPGGAGGRRSNMDRLRQLADAYGVEGVTLAPVADAIIRRTPISAGGNERTSVFAVVSLIVRDEGTVDALMSGRDIPRELYDAMVTAVTPHGPAMPASTLVDLVLRDVRAIRAGGAA